MATYRCIHWGTTSPFLPLERPRCHLTNAYSHRVVCFSPYNVGVTMTIKHAAAFAIALGCSAPALASNPACARKVADIESQIHHAKAAGNQHRVKGLQRALSAAQQHCTDAGLIADIEEEIADKREDLNDILEDIHEKEEEGRIDKAERLERKLAHEQEELKILMKELEEIRSLSGANTK